MYFLCFIFSFLSEKQTFSGLHVHGKPCLRVVQGAVGQDSAAVGQWFQRSGRFQCLKLLGITGYAVSAQLAVKCTAHSSAAQLVAKGFSFANGQVNGAGGGFDQMELFSHLCKRENAARDPLAKGVQNAACVQCGLTPRKIQLLKISSDRLRAVQRCGAACCVLHGVYVLAQHLRYAAAFQRKTVY